MTPLGRGKLALALKLAATLALLGVVLAHVDLGQMVSHLSGGRIAIALAAGAAVLALQAALAAFRLRLCVQLLGQGLTRFDAWTACQFGGLFSHTPMSFVGGDAMRLWHLTRSAVPLAAGAKAVLLDRALGLVGMMALVLATAPALQSRIQEPAMRSGYLVLLALGTCAVVAFLSLGRLRVVLRYGRVVRTLAELATVSRYLRANAATAAAFVLAVLINAMNGLAIWLIALCFGAGISFTAAMLASPVVFLVAMIPVSVAGWGLREGAFVIAFALFGVSSADALAASVTFGIAVLLAYSPALPLLMLARRRGGDGAAKAGGCAQASSPPTARS